MGSLFGDPDAAGAVTVPVARLDAVLAGTTPTLIKLDLEGGEAAALRGAHGLLDAAAPPAVVVEFDAGHLARAGETPATLVGSVLSANPAYACRVLETGASIGPVGEGLDKHTRQDNLLFTAGEAAA